MPTLTELRLIPLAVLILVLIATFAISFRAGGLRLYCMAYLVGYVILLWHTFFSRAATTIGMLVKALVLVIVVPPVCLLVIQLFLGSRPYFVYPNSLRFDAILGPRIEMLSYATALAFASLVLLGAIQSCRVRRSLHKVALQQARVPRNNLSQGTRLRLEANPTIFWFFLSQSLVYSSFQLFGGHLSLLSGGYGLTEASRVLGINAWNAMGTICLVLATGFYDRRDGTSKLILWAVGLWIVAANLLNGNRADIIGLALLGVVVVARARLQIGRTVQIGLILLTTLVLAAVVGVYRSHDGVHGGHKEVRTVIQNSDSWYMQSVNDFFGTMPMVVSYVEFDEGALWYGRTYYICLTCLLPSSVNPWRINESATTYLQENYCMYNGGMYLPAELWMNFGLPGALLAAFLIGWTLRAVEKRLTQVPDSQSRAIVFAIAVGFPRWVLYGSSTFTKQLFLIALFWGAATVLTSWAATSIGACPQKFDKARIPMR